jgi:hypothetical protein
MILCTTYSSWYLMERIYIVVYHYYVMFKVEFILCPQANSAHLHAHFLACQWYMHRRAQPLGARRLPRRRVRRRRRAPGHRLGRVGRPLPARRGQSAPSAAPALRRQGRSRRSLRARAAGAPQRLERLARPLLDALSAGLMECAAEAAQERTLSQQSQQ